MSQLRRLVRASLAKALYSPFGLAWLRAREKNIGASAFRNAPSPTPPLMISALRVAQMFWPPRRTPSGQIASTGDEPGAFYSGATKATGSPLIAADVSAGPIIRLSGRLAPANMDVSLLAIARVKAAWPEAAWQLELDAQPAWLVHALLLEASPPEKSNGTPCITLAPPAHDDAVDGFVALALTAREQSR